MKLRVYKSLDKSSSLFGIRGSYIRIAGAGLALAVFLGMGIIGPVTDGLIGILSVVGFLVLDYLLVMSLQSRFTERQLDRWLSVRKLPYFILFPACSLKKFLRGVSVEDGKSLEEDLA